MKEKLYEIYTRPIIEELEPRQLFSGGLEGIIIEDPIAEPAIHLDIDAASSQTTDLINGGAPSNKTVLDQRQELVFIDTDVENYQELLNDILAQDGKGRNIEVITLDNERDGIEQISEALANYQNLDAVHLISHGSDGNIDVGNTQLDANALDQNLAEISAWGDAFTEEGDFLIYGCNLAATEDGQSLVQTLSGLTQTDVTASDDVTGNERLGGDWELEYSTGNIETAVAVGSHAQENWSNVLAITTDNVSTGTAITGDNSITISHKTSGTNRLLLVGISFGEDKGDDVSSVSYKGNPLSLIGARDNGDDALSRVEIWALVAPNNGNHNVVVNFSGNDHEGATIGVMTFSGVDQSTPLGSFASKESDSGDPSVTVSSATGEVVFGVVALSDSNDLPITPGAGQT